MVYYIRRAHRDYATYSTYYGELAPPRVSCPHEAFKRKGDDGLMREEDLSDHLLQVHGEEQLEDKTELEDLKRFHLTLLRPRVSEEAKALNDIKRRTQAAEDRLRDRGEYVSRHGLDVDRMGPQDDIVADTPREVAIDLLAIMLSGHSSRGGATGGPCGWWLGRLRRSVRGAGGDG